MNLVQKAIESGGSITPLIIPADVFPGTGLMNASVFKDDDGQILCIIRHINYTLYHSENNKNFPSVWGPLAYLHPEKDMNLRTTNYLCRLDDDFNVVDSTKIDTSILDILPVWEFVGLEDARLVKWDNKYYAIGVRRDVKSNGEGRMELSEIELDKEKWTAKEISRIRIPAPIDQNSYCEKNWMPIIDKPYHFIKWTSPTEVVKTYPELPERCEQVFKSNSKPFSIDQRGGTQLIPYGNNYIAITHEVNLFNNYLNQKDGKYRHRLCVWDKDFNLIGISPESFSFMDADIEFAVGMTFVNSDLIISFGFQDNAAFVLKVPRNVISEMFDEAIKYEFN